MTDSLPFLNLESGYSTSYNDLIHEFYAPCLEVSTQYDRAVGYFRSSLYVLVGLAFSDFAMRNGKVRLVCSPSLSDQDIDAIAVGYDQRASLSEQMLREVRGILSSPENRPLAEFLATLISAGALDIKLAFRQDATGIFHDKVGIFSDAFGNSVSFVGSANETFSAWSPTANHEGFEVFESWQGESQGERVARHKARFEALWENRVTGIQTRDFPSVARDELLAYANPAGVDDAAMAVRQLVSAGGTHQPYPQVQPQPRVLQRHQELIAEAWRLNGGRGIIDHVTGAGKTVTALAIIRQWIETGRPALILVPSELLASQWRHEIDTALGEIRPGVLQAGAGYGRASWATDLASYTRDLPDLGPRVVISTIQTATTPIFRELLRSGPHLLVVADEVHHIGAPSTPPLLEVSAGGVLGLSATPERFGDPDGTARIFDYFGPVLKPSFGIPEAIAAGRLVPYDYYVHTCELSDVEQDDWDAISINIGREFARLPERGSGFRAHSDYLRILLMQRARIIKNATSKVAVSLSVIAANYAPGEKWLAYCDNQQQLGNVLNGLRGMGIPSDEYHSAMLGNRNATLKHFVRAGGVLVSIKCLDEGVDIPLLDRAIILASSTNTREFIQRRGRVLRTAPGKSSARIHDLLVIPTSDGGDGGIDRRAIVRSELRRALEFALSARNSAVTGEIQMIATGAGVPGLGRVDGDEFEEPDNARE